MGLCPNPRKFFEKNLTKNFHTGKFFIDIIRSTVVNAEFIMQNTERVINELFAKYSFVYHPERSRTRRAMRSIGIYNGLLLCLFFNKSNFHPKKGSKTLFEIPAVLSHLGLLVTLANFDSALLRSG